MSMWIDIGTIGYGGGEWVQSINTDEIEIANLDPQHASSITLKTGKVISIHSNGVRAARKALGLPELNYDIQGNPTMKLATPEEGKE